MYIIIFLVIIFLLGQGLKQLNVHLINQGRQIRILLRIPFSQSVEHKRLRSYDFIKVTIE